MMLRQVAYDRISYTWMIGSSVWQQNVAQTITRSPPVCCFQCNSSCIIACKDAHIFYHPVLFRRVQESVRTGIFYPWRYSLPTPISAESPQMWMCQASPMILPDLLNGVKIFSQNCRTGKVTLNNGMKNDCFECQELWINDCSVKVSGCVIIVESLSTGLEVLPECSPLVSSKYHIKNVHLQFDQW